MISKRRSIQDRLLLMSGMLAFSLVIGSGCTSITSAYHSIPASRVHRNFMGDVKEGRTPIPYTALGQEKPAAHILAPGDKLSLYVYGVSPPGTDSTPVLQRSQVVNQRYYPPRGSIVGATIGLPINVEADGTMDLPLVGPTNVEGLTIREAAEVIKQAYRARKVVQQDRERVQLSLITPRVHRVVVLRQDTPNVNVALPNPGVVDYIHRGSGEVIDLPAYENDVLHALSATGGLPGTDAARELWVFKRAGLANPHAVTPEELQVHTVSYQSGSCPPQVVRIPLTGCPGEPVPFTVQDVTLEEGDVLYLPRREEFFYTGGLLAGAKIPLPRDEDIDVIEALTLANGSNGGPLGQSGQALAGGTPGYVVRPTRVIILRELPDGEQVSIRVDLARAMKDQKERIFIQPNDVIMLQFKPQQAIANGALNLFNFSIGTRFAN